MAGCNRRHGAGVGSRFNSRGNSEAARRSHQKYPRPPYNKQSQPWPGLASKMDPAPDHGEKSYRGSGRLAGRKALVTGGDSGMGRAAAIAFAREGADVAINYLPSQEPDAREVVGVDPGCGKEGRTYSRRSQRRRRFVVVWWKTRFANLAASTSS